MLFNSAVTGRGKKNNWSPWQLDYHPGDFISVGFAARNESQPRKTGAYATCRLRR
jgi:hypothetical protein